MIQFVMESLPTDRRFEGGIINPGFVAEVTSQKKCPHEGLQMGRPPSSIDSTSEYFSSGVSCVDSETGLSLSVKLRRPEVMLFTTKMALLVRMEFLLDYSRHSGRESLVCSLSGLHVLSKIQNHISPKSAYLVLNPCDIEVEKTLRSVEEGIKISVCVSAINLNLSTATAQTIVDIVNEISETLRMNDDRYDLNELGGDCSDYENLWSPKKISPSLYFDSLNSNVNCCQSYCSKLNETFTILLPKIQVVFEVEDFSRRIPVLLLKAKFETNMKNWSSGLQLKMDLLFQASCYNGDKGVWEPLIEPVSEAENVFRPWELTMKILTAKAYPLSNHLHFSGKFSEKDRSGSCSEVKSNDSKRHKSNSLDSETSDDESGYENESMVFIRKHRGNSVRAGKQDERSSLIGFPEDSDSENENAVIEKLANAVGHLFTGESVDSESDQENSSEVEQSVETEEETENEASVGASTVVGTQERTVFLNNRSDSLDSGLEPEMQAEKTATYVIIEAKDRLELSLTSNAIRVLTELMDAYAIKTPLPRIRTNQLSLHNDISPDSVASLLQRAKTGGSKVLIKSSYNILDSTPSGSPSGSVSPDSKNSGFENDIESFEGGFAALSSNDKNTDGNVDSNSFDFTSETFANIYKKIADFYLQIQVPGFDNLQVLCPQRTVSKFHLLQPIKNNTRYYITLDIQANEFKRVIHVRCPLQVKNDTHFPIGLYYKKQSLSPLGFEEIGESVNPFEDFNRIIVLEPDQIYSVPLTVAYHCRLHVMPAFVESYHVSEVGIWWQEMAAEIHTPKDLVCAPKQQSGSNSFSVRAICIENQPTTNKTCRTIPNYMLHLLPSVTIHNRLPLGMRILLPSSEQALEIEPSGNAITHCYDLSKPNKISVEVVNYLGSTWCGSFNLTIDTVEKIVTMTQSQQDGDTSIKQLFLNAHVERTDSCSITLFTQYWIANKTELLLQVRASTSDSVFEIKGEGPILFCYRKQRRRAVRLRANQSSWSSAFSIDTLSCPGVVICRDKERKKSYRILMNISSSMSCPHLTKIITFLPNFLITNQCFRPIRFMEDNEKADLWFDLQHGQSVPFWPETESMSMFVKFRDSKLGSQHFSICTVQQTVLRMDKGTGLVVDVSGGETKPFTVMFRRYNPGDAPLRVDNLCQDLFLKIHQQHLGQVALLSPCQSLLYTWDDPSKERVLLWNVYNKKCSGFYANFGRDGYGQERVSFHMVKQQNNQQTLTAVGAKLSAGLKKLSSSRQEKKSNKGSSSSDDSDLDEKPQLSKKTRKDKVTVYWVSYLEGFQRVLLFTQDEKLAYQMRKKIDFEKSNTELFFSLKGIGISLMHERKSLLQEVVYMNVMDSAVLWEVCVAHRWKLLTLELASWVEASWLSGCKRVQLKDYVQIDFEKMLMTKPFYGELRRFYNPAVWLQLRKSNHYLYVQCKIHKLQIDSQLPDAVFPVVFYSSTTPLPVLRKVGLKPCIDIAVMKRNQPIHNQIVFKFLRASFHDFIIQLDHDFISSVFLLLSPLIEAEKPSVRIRSDIAAMHHPVMMKTGDQTFLIDRTIIEQISVSPLNFTLSYSQTSSSLDKNLYSQTLTDHSYAADVLFYALEILAPLINDIKSVHFRTLYFKQYGVTKNIQSVLKTIALHSSIQLMQQFYVNVLKWDVLSSPYCSNYGRSSDDISLNFMEKELQDADELSEGLCTSARCLMGHIVGCSTASALITSTFHNSNCSMLNFNQDSNKKNVYYLQQSTLPGFIIAANNSLELGVMLGFSGVTVKHSTGNQQEGIENFFRGVGKGLFTLLTQPLVRVGDIVEMASNGIRRAVEMGEEIVHRSRLPRHVNPYFGVRPYSLFEATGVMLLHSLSKGHYIDTDCYWAHAPLHPSGKICLLITLQHIFLLQKPRQWGAWEIEWLIRIDDVMQVPHVKDCKLILQVRQDQNSSYVSNNEIVVSCDDNSTLDWLQKQIEAVIILSMEDKPFSDVEVKEDIA